MSERQKKDAPTSARPVPSEGTAGGKGRPTPKRNVAQAKNQRPLVPSDRKAARKAQREQRNIAYARQQEAMRTGDEKYLPTRDKGPARRWVRNYIDSRWSPSEYFLPLAMGSIVLLLFASLIPEVAVVGMLAMYVAFAIAIIFALSFTFSAMRKLKQRFTPDEIPRMTGLYAFTRVFQPRFLRAPKPQVKRGQPID
ncbi:DUF3043 domain-containing protein [Georgenia wangjunii]|uniref:DUF3043 domain-containing protein n=1 Tax=Georgenia wangjunii TaxID=3117730 RepID=UPI002F26C202